MKIHLLTLSTLLTISSAASADIKYVCRELEGERKTVVLTSEETELKEGVAQRFIVNIYGKNPVMDELTVAGVVNTEDVGFDFVSNDKKVSFSMYMDEMDQSTLSIKGKESISMVCY